MALLGIGAPLTAAPAPQDMERHLSRPAPGGPGSGRAQEFDLLDQHGRALAYRFPKAKVSVLTFGDRRGSAQIDGWVRPLYQRYQNRIDIHGVAVLSSVPTFARGIVRRLFLRRVSYPVLLDWQGKVSQSYGYQSDRATVVVIDRGGKIIFRGAGSASPGEMGRLCESIDRLLAG